MKSLLRSVRARFGSRDTAVYNPLSTRPIVGDANETLRHIYRHYFTNETCKFVAASEAPYIIDCGAHVGISVLYWKSLFPCARVVAFEPDPDNFAALAENCSGLSGVSLHNVAVWQCEGAAEFSAVGSLGGHLALFADRGTAIQVKTVRLRPFLSEPVDMLKLDIEGAEVDVLTDSSDLLPNVRNLFVEYHSFVGRPQSLSQLFDILERAGFRIHAHSELPAARPFVERPVVNHKDFRLNIFAVRESI